MKMHYRAAVYGDELVPYIHDYYVLYSTDFYDMCTDSLHIANLSAGKTNKEIRALCKQYYCRIKKIDKTYSKFARKTPEDAINHLITRRQWRNHKLKQYITENEQFINNAIKVGPAQLVLNCNALYHTTYQVNNP